MLISGDPGGYFHCPRLAAKSPQLGKQTATLKDAVPVLERQGSFNQKTTQCRPGCSYKHKIPKFSSSKTRPKRPEEPQENP